MPEERCQLFGPGGLPVPAEVTGADWYAWPARPGTQFPFARRPEDVARVGLDLFVGAHTARETIARAEHAVAAIHLARAAAWHPGRRWLAVGLARCDCPSQPFRQPASRPRYVRWLAVQVWECHAVAVPEGLPLADVVAFELDRQSWPVYHDWCVDRGWEERAGLLAAGMVLSPPPR
jgi:hypothetical protein